MDSLKSMNRALTYIEENLTNDIDFKEAAKLAFCSEYHFKRMFSFLTGISLSEYIRRRRLTLAAFELKDRSAKVIDIAIKYGYHSPDSFARAFQHLHGIRPSEAKHNGHSLKAYPRMTFQLSIKGGNEMNYRIEEKEAFCIVGIKKRVPIIFKGVNPDIASMWESLDEETINELKELSNTTPLDSLVHPQTFLKAVQRRRGSLITILAQQQRDSVQITYRSLKFLPQRGLYSKQSDHFRMRCKKCGDGFIPNGFHRQIMNK